MAYAECEDEAGQPDGAARLDGGDEVADGRFAVAFARA